MLSSVALFQPKSGILSGLRASLVFQAKALSLGKCSIISTTRSNGFKWEMCAHVVGATVPLQGKLYLVSFYAYDSVGSLHTVGPKSSGYGPSMSLIGFVEFGQTF